MVTVSSNNTVEKDMKTKHVKKQIPATEKSASSDTQKSVETLEKNFCCRFGDECAYKHKETYSRPPIKEIKQKHADEMKAIQYEVSLLKTKISIMKKKESDIT